MQSYEEAPPPYSALGAPPSAGPTVVTAKGDYRGVPVYEVGPSNGPIYNPMAYQTGPSMPVEPTIVHARVMQVGHNPVQCICPRCHQQIISRVDYESGSFAWLMCLLLTIVGCIPCCIIPFCASSCQDATHTCPHCSAIIGRRKVL